MTTDPIVGTLTKLGALRDRLDPDDASAVTDAMTHLHRTLDPQQRGPNWATIPTTNEIRGYLHCATCLTEMTDLAAIQGSAKPSLYTRYGVGLTPIGLQVICLRHDRNVVHIDFGGHATHSNFDG